MVAAITDGVFYVFYGAGETEIMKPPYYEVWGCHSLGFCKGFMVTEPFLHEDLELLN